MVRTNFFFPLINHPQLSDAYNDSIWEFAQDMYHKQQKKDDHGYHFGTVNVLDPQIRKRLAEIERYYAATPSEARRRTLLVPVRTYKYIVLYLHTQAARKHEYIYQQHTQYI